MHCICTVAPHIYTRTHAYSTYVRREWKCARLLTTYGDLQRWRPKCANDFIQMTSFQTSSEWCKFKLGASTQGSASIYRLMQHCRCKVVAVSHTRNYCIRHYYTTNLRRVLYIKQGSVGSGRVRANKVFQNGSISRTEPTANAIIQRFNLQLDISLKYFIYINVNVFQSTILYTRSINTTLKIWGRPLITRVLKSGT